MDKFTLIYEFNKDSPLLTYQAAKEIDSKNYKKALDLLTKATNKYPDHLTAVLLYSLALAYNEKYEEAKGALIKAINLQVDNETLDYYKRKIESIKREAEGININLDDTVNEILNESFLESEEYDAEKDLELLDDNFKESVTSNETELGNNPIVTETLAEIYASQENYEEALDIYQKLISINPEMEDKFNKRIYEIKTAIDIKKQKKFGN